MKSGVGVWALIVLFGGMAAGVKAAPVISVDSAKTDFGTYPANRAREHVFILKNTGDQPLKIINIRKTCGCSEARLERNELPSGTTARLTAVIKAGSVTGPYSKNLFVESNDPKQRFLMLLLNGNAVPLVTVKPQDKIYAGTLAVNRPWQQEFVLETTRDGVTFGPVKTNAPATAIVTVTPAAPRQFKLMVKLPPMAQPGGFNVKITVPISSPSGWPPIELFISGRRLPPRT